MSDLHDLGRVFWVGSVPYRSCTAYNNRIKADEDLDYLSVDDISLSVDDLSVDDLSVDLSVDDLSVIYL